MAVKAVITADIVNSTRLPVPVERKLIKGIQDILKPYQYEFYRGDSFQVYLKQPATALSLVLQLRAYARSVGKKTTAEADIRTSIGIGAVSGTVSSLAAARGEAFVLSGRAFDALHQADTRLVIAAANEPVAMGLTVLADFVDFLFNGLTVRQATVLYELLQGQTQTQAAKKLKRAQPTIHKHAQAAGWHAIEKLLQQYEQFINLLS